MIEVTNLKKSFRNKNIIENISFRVERGEQLAILGRNGCGKSTLIKILAGIQKPDGGEITYFNQNPLAAPKLFRTYCGYVPQENPLIYELSVQDNLSLWSGKRGKQNEEIIRWFELDELLKCKVDKLSGGMKRRVSIACAVINNPPILFMDEPTTSLDTYYQSVIHKFMREYREKNGIIVLTTHDKKEIADSSQCITLKAVPSEVM